MKTTICLAFLTALTLIESGCYTSPPPVAYQAPVVAPAPQPPVDYQAPAVAPPPPPTEPAEAPLTPVPPPTGYVTYAPEYFSWDGSEYVGVSNGQYVYWGGGAWIIAPPAIMFRFHGWERFHPDWRRHAIQYRRRFR